VLTSGTSEDAKPFDFIGLVIARVFEEEISLAEAREAIQQATRRYQNASYVVSQGAGRTLVFRIRDEPARASRGNALASVAGLG